MRVGRIWIVGYWWICWGWQEVKVLEPLDLLRLKWCSEPSVHGGKGTGP